jgi:hypothetical protein
MKYNIPDWHVKKNGGDIIRIIIIVIVRPDDGAGEIPEKC